MKLFIPITKIDLEKREVWGVAAEEAPDKSGEIMDYARSKPHFMAWSEEISKASGGKSLGNLRAMHQPIAAGKLIHFEARDEEKQFFVGAKVVDDSEWEKVKEGVYTGFSIGGDYVEKWKDPGNPALMRYEAQPAELSLADNPCMHGAVFQAVKADGVVEMCKFERPGFSKIEEREEDGPPSAEKVDLTSPPPTYGRGRPAPLPEGEGRVVEKVGRMLNSVNAESLRTMLAMLADMLAAAGDDLGGKVKLLLDDSGGEPDKDQSETTKVVTTELRKEVSDMPKTFTQMVEERQMKDAFWELFRVLDDCVWLIFNEKDVSVEEKKTLALQAINEFAAQIEAGISTITPEAMEMAAKMRNPDKTEVEVEIAKIAGQLGEIEKASAKVAEVEKLTGKIGELEKLVETVAALDARLAKVETQPVGEPPVLRQVQTQGASGVAGELAVLDGMIEQETNPLVKEALGKRRALLMLKTKS